MDTTTIEINNNQLLAQLWKNKNVDYFVPKDFPKQREALKVLLNNETKYFAFGGAAGGGKSWAGCTWLVMNCVAYPNTRWFIGREELKRLTESTLETLYKVCQEYDITGWRFNGQKNFIRFNNGSQINLLELQKKPSDEMYERYGSTEYTGGWIEEGGEVHFDAYDTLKSRVGRQLNMNYCGHCGTYIKRPKKSEDKKLIYCEECGSWTNGLPPKLFVTCNPKKNWLYTYFYKPSTQGKLPSDTKFLQSLVTDNPKIEAGYIDNLNNIQNEAKKQRLRYGNWEYDDDPAALIDWDSIQDFFTNEHVFTDNKMYLTADIAMQGSDRFVIIIWNGWIVVDIVIMPRSNGKEVLELIKETSRKHSVPRSNICFDNDGIGSYLSGFLQGAFAFVNGGRPVYQRKRDQDQYQNLKTQCYFHFAKIITEKKAWMKYRLNPDLREELETEMSWIKNRSIDTDNKLAILKKEDVKEAIGRSPDLTDALMMRSVFDLRQAKRGIRTH